MSNANAKFGTRSWLNALVMAYLVQGGTITKCNHPKRRGGRTWAFHATNGMVN
jgi:hypothetical protein